MRKRRRRAGHRPPGRGMKRFTGWAPHSSSDNSLHMHALVYCVSARKEARAMRGSRLSADGRIQRTLPHSDGATQNRKRFRGWLSAVEPHEYRLRPGGILEVVEVAKTVKHEPLKSSRRQIYGLTAARKGLIEFELDRLDAILVSLLDGRK